ncbi:MAG: pectate lyase [Verrucomicrobia bacterium]|nr:pectate lyase [Verrucomicrobiota bacterium]
MNSDRMQPHGRQNRWIVALLGLTLLLWAAALGDLFRISPLFMWLVKRFPGSWVVFGAMLVCPFAAAILSWRRSRGAPRPRPWRLTSGLGGLLVLAWVATIGYAHLMKVAGPRPPQNPSAPRPLEAQVGLPVFPGAEGFGTRTRAGRGGKVIEVTSLADDGPGSLRAALADPNPRTIVFRVGGTIELREHVFINHPFVTVAGQTAPGDGICLKNAGLVVNTHDVLIQHLRVRPGNEGRVDADTNDAIQIFGHNGHPDGAHHVVLDHVSASWSEDETLSTWFGAHDITLSWCIISEALNRSRHRKQTHSAGLLIGNSSYHVSVHHCLFAHNDFRNPLIIDGGTHDLVNNVIYNWGVSPAEVVDYHSNTFLNFVGNCFLPGPSSRTPFYGIILAPDARDAVPQLFVQGNLGPSRPGGANAAGEWGLVNLRWGPDAVAPEKCRASAAFPTPAVTVSSASEILERVLAEAGAILPTRDAVDARVVANVRARSGAIIDSPAQVGGHPVLNSGTPPADADHDGMPDAWETAHGLNPNEATDSSGDLDSDGYTNLEEYLHSLSRRTTER